MFSGKNFIIKLFLYSSFTLGKVVQIYVCTRLEFSSTKKRKSANNTFSAN